MGIYVPVHVIFCGFLCLSVAESPRALFCNESNGIWKEVQGLRILGLELDEIVATRSKVPGPKPADSASCQMSSGLARPDFAY